MPSLNTLKQEAKQLNGAAQVGVYSFTLLFWAITTVLTAVNRYLNRSALAEQLLTLTARADLPDAFSAVNDVLQTAAQSGPAVSPAVLTFAGVFILLLNALLSAGYTLYMMGIRRREQMSYDALFDGFAFAGKIIALELWRTLVVAVWSMLFIVPGIVVYYRYSFALYALLDDPNISVLDALNVSRQHTRGYKWQLFLLDLSFLGWGVLSALTGGLASVYAKPYREQTWLGFYRAVKPDAPSGEDPANP